MKQRPPFTDRHRPACLNGCRSSAAAVAHLDATARERRYDNRITCALRAGYPGPFQAEGIAFAAWMDQCNALAYQLLAEVVAGTRKMPEHPQELIALMSTMVWPSGSAGAA